MLGIKGGGKERGRGRKRSKFGGKEECKILNGVRRKKFWT